MDDKRKIRVGRLQTAGDVRHELGRLYRAGRKEEIPAVSAYRLALILKIILGSIEADDLEQRILALEEMKHGK